MILENLDTQICSLAEEYIANNYYCVGNRSYAWTERDEQDDLERENVVSGELAPSDVEDYSWWEIVSCDIHKSEIDSRNDETGEYCVNVEAWVAVSSGNRDDDVDESVSPELHTVSVHIRWDKKRQKACVVFAEE